MDKLSKNVTASRYLIFFLLFFLLHYIEGVKLGGSFSIAQIWKIPLMVYLLIYTFKNIRKRFLFEKANYLTTEEFFLNKEVLLNPLNLFIGASKLLPLTLFFSYWIGKFKHKYFFLEKLLYWLAQFICLSSFLTLFNIITPLYDYSSAEYFGGEDLAYYSSVFTTSHAASSYFVISILTLINGFLNNQFKTKKSKIFNSSLLIIALVSLFKAYVRTGWMMLIIGLIGFIDFSHITRKKIINIFFFLVISGIGLTYFYNTNEAFKARITGRNIYTNNDANSIDLSGSGRNIFWKNAIEGWKEGNFYELLFGQGHSSVTERNYQSTGLRVFSHNQFLDALAQNGIIGFSLLISYYLFIFLFIRRRKIYKYYNLSFSILLSAITFSVFQSEMYFMFAVIFSISLALLYLEKEKSNKH